MVADNDLPPNQLPEHDIKQHFGRVQISTGTDDQMNN